MPTAARWPCAAPVLAFVEPVGVDQRERDREQARALVMVDDDHVEAGGVGLLERLERLRAAIDGDDQARAALLQLDQRLARRAVALHQPVGDVDDRARRRAGAAAAPAAPRWSRRRRHSRRRWRWSRRPRPRRRGARRPCPCPGSSDGSGRKSRIVGRAVAGEVVALDAAGEQQLVDQRVRASARARPSAASATAGRSPTVRHSARSSCDAG